MVLYLSLIMCPGTSSSAALTKLGGIFCGGDREGLDVKTNPQTHLTPSSHVEVALNVPTLDTQEATGVFLKQQIKLPGTLHSVSLCPRRPAAASCA